MESKVIKNFTDYEIKEVLYKIEHGHYINQEDIEILVYASKKWLEFKEECKSDPSYQWGYGNIHY